VKIVTDHFTQNDSYPVYRRDYQLDIKLSIIVPTKNREDDLLNCVKSIIEQSVQPDELIIVDDGNLNSNQLDEILAKTKVKFVYLKKSKPGLAKSRNLGIQKAIGDIIMFLDDDVILDKDYVMNILEVFENDKSNKIGGVGGDIVNTPDDSHFYFNKIQKVMKKIFLISSDEQGTILPSGFDVPVGRVNYRKKVDILAGCNMSYRRIAIDSIDPFDENLHGATGYSHGEDTDFSYRISRKYELIVTPLAKIVHLGSPTGRMTQREFTSHMISNRSYFLNKNMPKTALSRLCFFWAMFGLFCMTILRFFRKPNKERLQDILGWMDILTVPKERIK